MLIAFWSAKGGAGTTVVAASVALTLAHRQPSGALMADLAGDVPAVLGAPEPDSPGLAGWLQTDKAVADSALEQLELKVAPGLGLLPRGDGPLPVERGGELASVLGHGRRHVVADCGTLRHSARDTAATAIARAAERSLLVIRPDYLSLRHAIGAPIRPTGAVVVQQPGRSLGASDVERVLSVPVLAKIDDDPAVARAVDAGMLAGRLPRALQRALRPVTEPHTLDRPSRHIDTAAVQPPPEVPL